MGWLSELSQVLSKYTGSPQTSGDSQSTEEQDFDTVVSSAPKSVIAQGIAEAFRSHQTPAFPQMMQGLFNQSNGEQKCGLINQLLGAAEPTFLSKMMSGGALSGLAPAAGEARPEVNPNTVQQFSPEAVQQLAEHAEQNNPSIVDTVGHFYAEHPTLVKALGVAALSVAMSKMGRRAA